MIQWYYTAIDLWQPYEYRYHDEFTIKDHYKNSHGDKWAFFRSFKSAKKYILKKLIKGSDCSWRIIDLENEMIVYEIHPTRYLQKPLFENKE